MDHNEIMDNICKEYETQTNFSKSFDVLCASKDKLKAITLIVERYNCDFDTARIVCDYFIDGTPLPSSLSPTQIAHNNAVAQEWQNKPKCPTCGSQNIEKISLTKKAFGGAMFGLFSTNVRNIMHCKNCGYKW